MASHHGMHDLKGAHAHSSYHRPHDEQANRFRRLFDLPGLYTNPEDLVSLGAKDGPMDAGTNANRTDSVAVGLIFFGQFVDHDITLDVTSSFSEVAVPSEVANVRTPTLDLDCVYGQGPEASPFLYHGRGDYAGIKLLTGDDGTAADQTPDLAANDLQRTVHGTAIIGDPRNDENRVISQLQLGMIRFHNKVVDYLNHEEPQLMAEGELFEKARELVTWHYQWSITQDFLVNLCGRAVVNDILGNGRKFYCNHYSEPFIPIEFAVAAYRFGHSMIPQRIQVQRGQSALELFGSTLGTGFQPLADERGVVDWNELLFTQQNAVVQLAEKLDSGLASDLLDLPFITAGGVSSLATRNLMRGQTFQLPSGENIAQCMEIDPSVIETVSLAAQDIAGNDIDLSSGTPLWFYILVEAEKIGRETSPGHHEEGEGLGPVGARIVAETLIGLMELDERSYLATNRAWTPADGVGVSTVGEMLTY